jgi:catechol 2,3-dioxygenase-like lactoylglutathione lyase family enzyme
MLRHNKEAARFYIAMLRVGDGAQTKTWESLMQIRLASVMVENQENALRFYTAILGFVKNKDIPMGAFRWLTVSSPEGAEGVELVLEPMGFAPAQTYQKALFAAGIPATAFITGDIQSEYRRLKELGVVFRGEPQRMGPITAVVFEDTCGNLINLVQPA